MQRKTTQGLYRTYSGSGVYHQWIRLVTSLILGSLALTLQAQQENPFELKNRRLPKRPEKDSSLIKNTGEIADTLIVSLDSARLDTFGSDSAVFDIFSPLSDSAEVDSLAPKIDTIPFDSLPIELVTDSNLVDSSIVDSALIQGEVQEPTTQNTGKETDVGLVERLDELPFDGELEVENKNVYLGVSILALLLLASLLAVNRSLIRKAYRAIANDNYLRFLNREYKSMPWLYWLFYLHFFINAGFFTYLFLHYFDWYHGGSIVVMLFCIFFVFATYILKHLTLNTIASAFPVEKETSLYGFVTLLVNILLGVALLPLNLLIAFGPSSVVPFAVWAGISLIILLYLFRQLKGLFIGGRLLRSYVFHFFLYLCTAEIAPLLIVGKLALGNFG